MADHHSYKASLKKLDSGEVEIKSEVPAAEFDEVIETTLIEIRKNIEIPGFRKGAAPEKLVREKIGEAALLYEAAEHAISHAYAHILAAEKVDAIGYPKVSITKIAAGNPLAFTITTAVVPEIKDLDYKKIAASENAKKPETSEVTDADLEKAIEEVKNNFSRSAAGKKDEKTAAPLELTDELVKTWGEFKDIADFKDKLRSNLRAEKEQRAFEKKRLSLIETLTKDLKVSIPAVLIETELARMSDQMKHDIERMGLKFDDYIKHLGKTVDDLKKEWRPDAEKRVKLDLILAHIARAESLSADKKRVDEELAHIREHHKDIDPERARAYFESVLLNQAVFEFLEKQK
ncbi:MAG: hypothetical protein KGH68_02890 [Patescibacteria group bacterium]|nr:hypothetical protein [Patescibacteria group bacterium]